MATPLDLRNRRREAQRTVRLALNAINSALDSWKLAAGEGKQHATALSNAVLNERHLPLLPLGALEGVPGLLPAAAAKLQQRQEREFEALQGCLQRLLSAVEGLRAAVASVVALVEVEASAPLLGDGAVFAALSLGTIGRLLGEVLQMYEAELRVKEAVVEGFQRVPGEFLGRAPPREASGTGGGNGSVGWGTGGSSGGGGGGGSAGMRPEAQEERLKDRMHVYIAAWMLAPELDEARAEAHLATITEDMRGF